jgi:hypothetical protein
MKRDDRFERMIRVFPSKWKERYGVGMVALLEDSYGERRIPLRARFALQANGARERAREFGFIGDITSAGERLRAGLSLILCGWALFMIAGADFEKFSEHWNIATPYAHHTLPNAAYLSVEAAGIAGVAVVLFAALLTLPALIRFIRSGNWSLVRRPVYRVATAGISLVTFTALLSVWAHVMNNRDRNGGLLPYEIIFLVWCIAVAVTLFLATSAAIVVVRHLALTQRVTCALVVLSLVLTLLMLAIVAGIVIWWGSESIYAPRFLRNNIGGHIIATSSTYPLALVLAALLMVLGLVVAITGIVRVGRATKQTHVLSSEF